MKHPMPARSVTVVLALGLAGFVRAQPAPPAPSSADLNAASGTNQTSPPTELKSSPRRSLPDPGSPPARPGTTALPQSVALEPVKPGVKVSPDQVPIFRDQPFFAPNALRTFFLDFTVKDWEEQLAKLAATDATLPARLTLDGSTYAGVGTRFLSPDFPPGPGYKRSLALNVGPEPDRIGLRPLTLLDERTDPTYLRTLLYLHIAREYIPAPSASLVRTVINGEDWGIYTCVEPFDSGFTQDHFASTGGTRFVARGGTLAYLGDDPAAYRPLYRLLGNDDPAAWTALIKLCRVLNQTPRDKLEEALTPLLDVDEALKFLALENALINQSGYGSPGGSYGLYLDAAGRFHLVPQGAESSFRLVEVHEHDRSARGGGGRGSGRSAGDEKSAGPGANGADARADALVAKEAKKRNFPRQTGSDLGMLLSYALIARAGANADHQASKDEWLDFARGWFVVMDEDFMGRVSRDQFIAKVRLLITPPSVLDGRTQQTYGKDDVPARIGQDLFAAMDADHDGWLTREEFLGAFAAWFTAWSNPKTGQLTEDGLRAGLGTILTQTVFQADQSYVATQAPTNSDRADSGNRGGGRGGGRRSRGGGGGGESGDGNVASNVGIGPFHLGTGGLGGRGDQGRTTITFGEQLDPLADVDGDAKPLRSRLLAVSALRARYFEDISDIAEHWLTWDKLGPIAHEYHSLIAAEVEKDTHKPASYAHFVQDFDQEATADTRNSDIAASLKVFVAGRRAYLLDQLHPQ